MKNFFLSLILGIGLSSLQSVEYQVQDFNYLKSRMPKMRELLDMHFKLYAGYVGQVNQLSKLLDDLRSEKGGMKTFQDRFTYESIKRHFGWEYDSMRFHELYFQNLGGKGISLNHNSQLTSMIKRDFGSMGAWQADLENTCMVRGIGWAVLYWDPFKKVLYNDWVQDHDKGPLVGAVPIFVIDLWEHAYLTVFGLDRKAYVNFIFENADWSVVEERFCSALQEEEKTMPTKPRSRSWQESP